MGGLAALTIRRTDMPESCDEIKKLRKRFEKHMDDHRLDEATYIERQVKQDLAHEKTTEAICELTKAVKPLVDGITVLVTLQKLVKWASGFAFIGVIIAAVTGHNPFK